MEVEYSVFVEGLEAFQRHQRGEKPDSKPGKHNSQWPWLVILVALVGAKILLPTQTGYLMDAIGNSSTLIVAFMLGLCSGTILMWFALKWQRKIDIRAMNQYRQDEYNRWCFEPHRLRIDSQGITSISMYQQTTISWAVVCKIETTPYHIFLHTTSLSATIIPRRAFRDQQQFEEFISLALHYKQEAAQTPSKPTGIMAGLPPQSDAITQ